MQTPPIAGDNVQGAFKTPVIYFRNIFTSKTLVLPKNTHKHTLDPAATAKINEMAFSTTYYRVF